MPCYHKKPPIITIQLYHKITENPIENRKNINKKVLQFVFLYVTISKLIRKSKRREKMQVVKYIMIAIYIVICLGLIILVMMQNKDSKGASGTITGSSTNNFYEKNKSRTREGKIKKWTIILGVVFLVYTIILGIIYMF